MITKETEKKKTKIPVELMPSEGKTKGNKK